MPVFSQTYKSKVWTVGQIKHEVKIPQLWVMHSLGAGGMADYWLTAKLRFNLRLFDMTRDYLP